MHALDQTARACGRPEHALWARELAVAAHRGFVHAPRGSARKCMVWKASTDLARALVPSMGQHDPLDGYVTCVQLATPPSVGPDLAPAIADFRALIEPAQLATTDPLGLGGLLCETHRLAQLGGDGALVPALLAAAEHGLAALAGTFDPGGRAAHRLAFRELGLALGLAAGARLAGLPALPGEVRERAQRIARLAPLGERIVAFWLDPASRATPAWQAHADIDDVMLAACLAPDGFLDLARH
jgi:hypothetical protein